MSNIKELIRAEIERRKVDALDKGFTFVPAALQNLLSFLDTLPDEPEQPTRGYDEAYLNEKIAKASKSWEGVDVDKFMDEVRGREPVTDCHELEDEMEKFGERWPYPASFDGYDKDWVDELAEECAKHFYELGKKDMKRKMVEGAVEADVNTYRNLAEGKSWAEFVVEMPTNNLGDKVKIIIVKEDGE